MKAVLMIFVMALGFSAQAKEEKPCPFRDFTPLMASTQPVKSLSGNSAVKGIGQK